MPMIASACWRYNKLRFDHPRFLSRWRILTGQTTDARIGQWSRNAKLPELGAQRLKSGESIMINALHGKVHGRNIEPTKIPAWPTAKRLRFK